MDISTESKFINNKLQFIFSFTEGDELSRITIKKPNFQSIESWQELCKCIENKKDYKLHIVRDGIVIIECVGDKIFLEKYTGNSTWKSISLLTDRYGGKFVNAIKSLFDDDSVVDYFKRTKKSDITTQVLILDSENNIPYRIRFTVCERDFYIFEDNLIGMDKWKEMYHAIGEKKVCRIDFRKDGKIICDGNNIKFSKGQELIISLSIDDYGDKVIECIEELIEKIEDRIYYKSEVDRLLII